MSDAIVINSLERALSDDINNLQAMATRQLADQILYRYAERFSQGDGGSDDTIPRSVTGGLAIRLSGAQVEILPGLLSQYSETFPAVPGVLESPQRLGYHRASVAFAHPGTPSRIMLVECQVVDVVTVNTPRDVFDVPTQTFVPTAVDKQTERQLAFQVVVGGGALQYPAFSGGDWVPLWFFSTDAGGLAVAGTAVDVRPDMQEVLPGNPRFAPFNEAQPEAVVVQSALSTRAPPAGGNIIAPVSVGGSVDGRIGDRQFALQSAGGVVVPINSVAPANNVLSHLYLVPLEAAGVKAVPRSGVSKGFPVFSDVSPTNGGRQNSAAIPLGGSFPGYVSVPAGDALYCGSFHGGAVAGSVEWLTQSGGGRCLVPIRAGSNLYQIVNLTNVFGALGFITGALDLRGLIPDAARTALLTVNVAGRGGVNTVGEVSFKPLLPASGHPGVADVTAPIDFHAALTDPNPVSVELEVPVFFDSGNNDDKQLEYRVSVDGAATVDLEISCHGWTL
jgi:hypothetical protein